MENIQWRDVFDSPKPLAKAVADLESGLKVVPVNVGIYENYGYAVVRDEEERVQVEGDYLKNPQTIYLGNTKILAIFFPADSMGCVLGEIHVYDKNYADKVQSVIKRITPKRNITCQNIGGINKILF